MDSVALIIDIWDFLNDESNDEINLPTSSSSEERLIARRFLNEEWQDLQHIVIDKFTETIYAAGVNRLYQLDQDLNLMQTVVTGSVNDSTICSARGCLGRHQYSMKLTNNTNKVLILDLFRRVILVCGTIHQGSCQVCNPHNISIVIQNITKPIVSNVANASTVAFIAPGPPNYPISHVLYVGATYSGSSFYRDEVPAVASRS